MSLNLLTSSAMRDCLGAGTREGCRTTIGGDEDDVVLKGDATILTILHLVLLTAVVIIMLAVSL